MKPLRRRAVYGCPLLRRWIMRRLAPRLLTVAILLLAWPSPSAWASGAPPIVAAAADLQFALEAVAERFTAETDQSVHLNFGSSGNFRRQIAQGAPFQLYFSADEAYVEALHREGFTLDEGTLYAIGRLVILAPGGDPAGIVDSSLDGLRKLLVQGLPGRFAIANPEHAPYGVAAMETLKSADLWEQIQPALVFGENVSQATRYALSGHARGGLVAYSLALAPPIAKRSTYALIPEDQHSPLRQRMALIKGAGETAHAFYDFVQTPQAKEILARYGFVLPVGE